MKFDAVAVAALRTGQHVVVERTAFQSAAAVQIAAVAEHLVRLERKR